jgi:hypothetical protein
MPYYDKSGKYAGGHGMKGSKKGLKMANHKYGESHMDRGASYRDTHQGYRSDAGKPKGTYGKPRAGYIDQSGMPNASKSKAYSYMSQAEGAREQAGNSGGKYGTSSTNIGTSPNEGSMDSTAKKKKKNQARAGY